MIGLGYLAAGVVIAAAFVSLRQMSPSDGTPVFFLVLAVAGAGYLFTLRALFQQRFPSRVILLCGLALALSWRLPLAIAPVGRDGDIYRYIWDARVQRAGLNPYLARPNDPAIEWLHTPLTRQMNNPDLPSPYPPVAQLYFRGVTALHESVEALKLSFVVGEALLVAVLWRWLAARGANPAWVLVYAWHPLATLEIARNGHFDVLGALLLCLSALALLRERGAWSLTWFALAVGVKLVPIVLASLYWRRVRVRDAALGAGVLVVLSSGFIVNGAVSAGSVPDVIDRFRFNAPLFEAAAALVGSWAAAGVALAMGLAVSVVSRRWDPARSPAAWAWPLGAVIAWSPLVYPWYLVWLLPFLTTTAAVPLMVWSLTIIPVYSVWSAFTTGAPWRVPDTLLLIEYGLPVVTAWWWMRRRTKIDARPSALPFTGRV